MSIFVVEKDFSEKLAENNSVFVGFSDLPTPARHGLHRKILTLMEETLMACTLCRVSCNTHRNLKDSGARKTAALRLSLYRVDCRHAVPQLLFQEAISFREVTTVVMLFYHGDSRACRDA